MSGRRSIRTSRIKKLNCRGRFAYVEANASITDEQILDRVYDDIAREFANRLPKFHKVKITRSPGRVEWDASLEVIVPETPNKKGKVKKLSPQSS
jgi:hypothetical protein